MISAVEFHGLRKRFGRLQVLDGIDAVLSAGRTNVWCWVSLPEAIQSIDGASATCPRARRFPKT
jgi:hypothetical protein